MALHALWHTVNESNRLCTKWAPLIKTQMLMCMQALCISLDFHLQFQKGTSPVTKSVSKSCFKSFSPLWMSQVSYWVQSSTRNLDLVNWIVILIPTEHLGSLYIKDRHLSLVFVIVPHSTTQWNGLKLQNTVSTSTIVNFEFFVEMIESFFPHFWHSQLFLGSLCALVLHTSFFIHIHVWLM